MTDDDLRTIVQRVLEMLARDHPDKAAAVVSALMLEALATGLHGDDEVATGEFVLAVNTKLIEIAEHHRSSRSWRLVAIDPPPKP